LLQGSSDTYTDAYVYGDADPHCDTDSHPDAAAAGELHVEWLRRLGRRRLRR
jgi:hypothetical protein